MKYVIIENCNDPEKAEFVTDEFQYRRVFDSRQSASAWIYEHGENAVDYKVYPD